MDCHDYSRVVRKPPNKWTTAQYVNLAFLTQNYQNDWKELAIIFNEQFRDELPTSDGLSTHALATMWYCMQRKICGKRAWEQWHATTSSQTSSGLVNQASIERTAIEFNIKLVRRVPEAVLQSSKAGNMSSETSRKHMLVQSDTEDFCQKPKKRRPNFVPETPKRSNTVVGDIGLLTPPSSTTTIHQQSQLPKPKKLPRVAFRAFYEGSQGTNSVYGFRAGAFVDSPTVPPPLSPHDPHYTDEAVRHVAPVPSGPTPFISVTRNLVRALHRALKLGLDSSIVVIDLHKADREGRVQSAAMLRLRVRHPYRPHGEYLIWGAIEPAAIISVLRLPELLAAMPTIPSDADPFRLEILRANRFLMPVRKSFLEDPLPMSFYTGVAVGSLLQALLIPAEVDLCEAAVYSILTDWKFEGCWPIWQANSSFRDGVEQAYQRKQSESEVPLSFKEIAECAEEIVDERATEEEYDRIAWADRTFDVAADEAEVAETKTKADTWDYRMSHEKPDLDDDEAFATTFINQLWEFIDTTDARIPTSIDEACDIPRTDHEDCLNDLESGGYVTEMVSYGLPAHEVRDDSDTGFPPESHLLGAFNGSQTCTLGNHSPLGARHAGWHSQSMVNNDVQNEDTWVDRSNKLWKDHRQNHMWGYKAVTPSATTTYPTSMAGQECETHVCSGHQGIHRIVRRCHDYC